MFNWSLFIKKEKHLFRGALAYLTILLLLGCSSTEPFYLSDSIQRY